MTALTQALIRQDAVSTEERETRWPAVSLNRYRIALLVQLEVVRLALESTDDRALTSWASLEIERALCTGDVSQRERILGDLIVELARSAATWTPRRPRGSESSRRSTSRRR